MTAAPFPVAAVRRRVRQVEGAALVAVRILLPGGERRESIPGQALLTGRMLGEGTLLRDFAAISADAEALGMIVGSFGGHEAHGLGIDALAADWREAIEWAAELLLEPTFPEERLRFLARQAAAELEAQADEADTITARAHLEQLWAPHPRSRPLQGDASSLASLVPEDCRRFHAAALGGSVIVTVAGAIDEGEVAEELRRRFGSDPRDARLSALPSEVPADSRSVSEVPADSWAEAAGRGVDPRPEPRPPSPAPPPRREIRTRARDQAHLFLGHLTIPRSHPDYPALELAGVLLGSGAGLTGRIPQRIREKEGLAYATAADTVTASSLDPGRLSIYVGTSPDTAAQAEASARDELARFVSGAISASELADAKSYLLGREPFRRETGRQWADLLAASELLGLPLDDPAWHTERLEAATVADVEAAVRRQLDPARLIVTLGLPA